MRRTSSNYLDIILATAICILFIYGIIYMCKICSTAREDFQNSSNVYYVVYISNSSCPYCIKFNSVFAEFQKEIINNKRIVAQKIDANSPEASHFDVDAYPTVIIADENGNELHKVTGYSDLMTFKNKIKNVLFIR